MSQFPQIGSAPAPGASAPVTNPLDGQVVLTAHGQSATAKGIQVTERALARIRVAMAKENVSPVDGGLRVGIQGGGCSGLSYNIRFDSQARERDRTYEFGDDNIKVFVDPKSFLYLHGMVLDYETTLMRQGFNFINPNSTKSCGCGSSFSA
jgi:iron-sulfur cluster assembly protein